MTRIVLPPESESLLPEPDERLVAPETRYEIEDGRVVYVAPADEPHGSLHAKLAAVIEAHRAEAYTVAVDMLTRTSRIDDIAPDVSVYPVARNPATGRRQLEEVAFEIASTESLGHAGRRAAKLTERGVRRVFAIDVSRQRALEWSPDLGAWSMLDRDATIEDRAFAMPLPVAALVDVVSADAAIRDAYRQRHEQADTEQARQILARALLALLAARGLTPTEAEREHIEAERDVARLERWLTTAVSCESVAALIR